MRRIGLLLALVIPLALIAAAVRVALSLSIAGPPARWTHDGADLHGDPLPSGAVARLGTVRFRTTTPTNLLWLDEDRLAGGGFDGEIVVWEASTGRRLQVLSGHRATLVAEPRTWSWRDLRRVLRGKDPPSLPDSLDELRLAADGRTLISTGSGIRAWDVDTGSGRLIAWPRGGNVTQFALADDGATLAYAWADCVRRFDLATGAELPRLRHADTEFSTTLAPAPDGSRLFGLAADATLRAFDTRTGEITPIGSPLPSHRAIRAHVGHDGDVLWCLCIDWPVPDQEPRVIRSSIARIALDGPAEPALHPLPPGRRGWAFAVSADGSLVALSGIGRPVEVRDARTLEVLHTAGAEGRVAWRCSFSPSARRLAWNDGTVSVLEIETGKLVATPVGHTAGVNALMFADAERVVSAASDGSLQGWHAPSRGTLWKRSEMEWVDGIRAAGAGRVLAVGSRRVETLDAGSGATLTVHEFDADAAPVHDAHPVAGVLLLDADGLAIRGSDDEPARPIHARTTRTAHDDRAFGFARLLGWWPEQSRMLVQEDHRETISENAYRTHSRLRLVNTDAAAPVWTADADRAVVAARHGDLVATGRESGEIRLLGGRGELLHRIEEAHGDDRTRSGPFGVLALAFSPDGRLLASGGADHVVRIWSLPDGRAAGTLRGHGGRVNAVAWSPDGAVLVSGSDDTTLLVWDVATPPDAR